MITNHKNGRRMICVMIYAMTAFIIVVNGLTLCLVIDSCISFFETIRADISVNRLLVITLTLVADIMIMAGSDRPLQDDILDDYLLK